MISTRRNDNGYPLSSRTGLPWAPNPLHRIELACQYHFRKKRSFRPNSIRLSPVKGDRVKPLTKQDVPLVFLCHNDRRFLPAFFAHHRRMGVTRFICVDDRSTDGSLDYLLAQKDTDLFHSDVRYCEAARGRLWRENLFHLYGYDRWYLNMDSDEFLVYETLERESVRDFAHRLQRKGIRRFPTAMIDLYPVISLRLATFDGHDRTMPWEVATHFDGAGYILSLDNKGISIRGGVRGRVFGLDVELIKYPLVFWDRRCSLGVSIHCPLPGIFNFPPAMGCLLHFKIFSDIRQRTQAAVRANQHFNGAQVYRQLQSYLDTNGDIRFAHECSLPYTGPQDLVERGFMLPLAS
ncbi:MAG: glycosyltransferase family 2 protein [Planctomycetaceae bacterium]|mgnify:CR=1 FL=1|nr:glycosyltransferase family 2 protein [Planctomycetaceae bacterium]